MNSRACRMGRRTFLARAGIAAAGAGLFSVARADVAPPNIVFVFSDEHRYQSMSFTEMPEIRTPTMARMAREGFTFHQAISNYPVCSPYRAMMMTGRYPCQTGVIDNNIPLKAAEVTIGDAFGGAGYRTAYIGKWHLGGVRAEPFGFDLSLIWTNTNEHWDVSLYHPRDSEPRQPQGYNATLMTDQAVDYINKAGEEPYLLMLSLNPPHWRFTDAPPEMRALYPDGSLPYRPNVCLDNAADDTHISQRNHSPHYEGYHAHITAIDRELERVLSAVEASSRARDTIVIYSSDHGTQFGSQGVGSKRQPFEESLRVPFMAYAPGRIEAGAESQALIGAQDVMPTLCGLAGIPVPDTCAGQDFSGHILHGSGPEPDAQLIMHIAKAGASGADAHPAPLFRGVRTARYTYAANEDGPMYLFDNQADPYQMNNLADSEAHAALRAGLHQRMMQLLREADDPFPDTARMAPAGA